MLYTFSYPIHFVSMYWHSFFFTLCRFQFRISDHSRISGLVFFLGGGGRTVQQQQRHPVTATGESIVWYHGDPWAGCRAAIPWGLAQGELVGHWVVRDDRDGVRDVESLNVMNLKACNRLGEFEGEFSKINFATLGISFVSFVTPAARA